MTSHRERAHPVPQRSPLRLRELRTPSPVTQLAREGRGWPQQTGCQTVKPTGPLASVSLCRAVPGARRSAATGRVGPAPTSAPATGLSAALARVLSACGLDETQQGQGLGGKVSGGRGQEHPVTRSGEKWKVKYLESHFSRPGGKCRDVSEGLDEQAFPPPTPTPRRRARGVCRNHGAGCSGPRPRGSGHFQGRSWRSGEMLSVRPRTRPGPPRLPGRAAASAAGS